MSFVPQQKAQAYLLRLEQVAQGPGPASQSAAASPVTAAPLHSLPSSLAVWSWTLSRKPLGMLCGLVCPGQGAVLGPLLLFLLPHLGFIHSFIHSSCTPGPARGYSYEQDDTDPFHDVSYSLVRVTVQQPSLFFIPVYCLLGR